MNTKNQRTWVSATAIFLWLPIALLGTHANAIQDRPFRAGMEAGRGVDLLSGDIRGVCVTRGVADRASGGQETKLSIEKIESKEQLRKSMGLDAQASITGLGSAKAEYLKSREVNQYSLYLLVKVSVRNSQRLMEIDKVALEPNAISLLKAKQGARFRERCGDAFINGVITGGEFFAIYEISTNSQEQREKLEIEAEASYGVFGGSAEFRKSMERISKAANTKVYVYRNGDNGTRLPQTAEEILSYAPNFPTIVATPKNAVDFDVLLLDYRTLSLPNDGESPLQTRLFEGEIEVLAVLDNQYDDSIHDLLYLLENEEEFESVTPQRKQELLGLLAEWQASRAKVRQKAIACFNREEEKCMKTFEPPLGAPIRTALPERHKKVASNQTVADLPESDPVPDAATLQSACDKLKIPANKDGALVSVSKKNGGLQVLYKGTPNVRSKILKMKKARQGSKGKVLEFWTHLKAGTRKRELQRGCSVIIDMDVEEDRPYCYLIKAVGARGTERAAQKCL